MTSVASQILCADQITNGNLYLLTGHCGSQVREAQSRPIKPPGFQTGKRHGQQDSFHLIEGQCAAAGACLRAEVQQRSDGDGVEGNAGTAHVPEDGEGAIQLRRPQRAARG